MSIYLIIAEVQTTNFYYEPVREHELMDQLMIVKILEKKVQMKSTARSLFFRLIENMWMYIYVQVCSDASIYKKY